jgi:hypothetical protein
MTMGEKTTKICLCLLMLLMILTATIVPAMTSPIQNTIATDNQKSKDLRYKSIEVWEDDFLNENKIDPNLSHHIVVNTSAGTVTMENTNPAWIDPAFSRMKPISILNNGEETFDFYDINLTVPYDAEMQSDFDDLRFTDDAGTQLSYFTFNKINSVSCEALVKIPDLTPGQTTIYMFYGNPMASDQSSFSSVFSWQDRTDPDTMVSFKATTEGAWDPDVIYGANRFLVTWEERLGPEEINVPLPHYERTIPGVIHGRSYNVSGGDPVPDNNSDIDVSDPGSDTYHAENPCSAFGDGKFFVVWEENLANQPLYRYEADIKGALVTPDSQVSMRFTICSVAGGQFEPQVAYDSQSNRFLVVWADARYGGNDYDVRGRLYYASGYPVGADFPIAYESYFQGNPWISSDNEGHFFIVFEDSIDGALGPFNLYAYRYDSNGNRIGSRITIAVGGDTVDNIFPAVSYNPQVERYCVTWNDGDISADPSDPNSYEGNVWGKILSNTGSVVKNNFLIDSGPNFVRTDSVPYFSTMFFVSYDGIVSENQDIYGLMIAEDGSVMTSRQGLSDGSSQDVTWNNLAVGAERIMVAWEDGRDILSQYADVFQYVWRSEQSTGSTNITQSLGTEEALITEAVLMSVPIQPEMFREWRQFCFIDSVPSQSTLVFDIMDESGTVLLKEDVENGENISDIMNPCVRLKATFDRVSPQNTPLLDKWNISVSTGNNIYAPETEIVLDPAMPDGKNDWYITPITTTFTVVDVDSDPENITTYYNINGFGVKVYDPASPPQISSDRPDNYIEYWSNDSVNEEYPHHVVDGIKLDTEVPMITLNKPSYIISPGPATINGSVAEYTTGSGIGRVKISINEEKVYDTSFNGAFLVWFEWNFTADRGETYDIYVEVWDLAGNTIEDRRTVQCPDHGTYEPGYIYLFNNPKFGPLRFLASLGLCVAVNYEALYVLLTGEIPSTAVSVNFVATQKFLHQELDFWDRNLSDGCSADLLVPLGIYRIKAYAYNDLNNIVKEYDIVTKILIITL